MGRFRWLMRLAKAQFLGRPRIVDVEGTLDMLVATDKSIARFGDGEFMLMSGKSIPFQEYSSSLSERLRETMTDPPENCEIGLGRICWYPDRRFQPHIRKYARKFVKNYGELMDALVDAERRYYDTNSTQFYNSCKPGTGFSGLFAKARAIWDGRDMLLVCGEGILSKLEHDIFDNASSVERISASPRNAWAQYDDILSKVKNAASGRLVLAILGPTATVLAADLCRSGIRALDVGHIAKDYDAYMRKLPTDMAANIEFYSPD